MQNIKVTETFVQGRIGETRTGALLRQMRGVWQLYALLVVPILFLAVFNYYPMYGALLAFKDYKVKLGILGSPWADQLGFENFLRFFSNYNFRECLINTVWLSLYSILASFPCSILLALGLNYAISVRFKKVVQLISYSPYFISMIVVAGMIGILLNTRTGALGRTVHALTGVNLLASASAFPSLYVWSGVWQGVGFGAIIYIASLAGVNPEQHEAAIIDGATILQRIRHVDMPAILPTATIMLILSMGGILNVGYEKVLAMQNPNNLRTSEVISTYAYKVALVSSIPDFSYATAIGLFQSLVGLLLILAVNRISRKLSSESLW